MATKKTSKGVVSKAVHKGGRGQSAKILTALYQIADAASAATDMQSFYKRLHKIVGKLMYAENFVIILYEAATNMRSYPYYADSAGDAAPPPSLVPEHSLLGEVIRRPHTIHYSRQENEEAVRSGLMFGTPAEDFVGVPLKVDNRVIGGIVVQSYVKDAAYSDEDVRVLEFVAHHIATALRRARAVEETRQRNAELAIINSVQGGLASKLDYQSIIDLVGEKIHEVFGAQDSFIGIYDKTSDTLSMPFMIERGKRLPKVEAEPLSEMGMRRWVIENKKPLVIDHDFEKRMVEEFKTLPLPTMTGWPKSGVVMPILLREDVIGIAGVSNYDREYVFSDSDVRLLQTLVNSMSVALENARLFDETQRLLKETEQRAAELAIINSVQQGLASKLDMQAIYDLIGDKIREIFDTQVVVIYRADLQADLYHPMYIFENGKRYFLEPRPLQPVNHMVEAMLRTRQAVVINTPQGFEEFRLHTIEGTLPSKSGVFAPLFVGEELRGAISLQSNERESAFSESDVRLLMTLANAMSVALENARLFDEVQRKNIEITEALNQQTATSGILRVIAESPTNIQPVLDAVAQYGARLSESVECAIFQRISEDQIKLAAHAGPDLVYPLGSAWPLNRGNIASAAILDKQILHIPDIEQTGEKFPLTRTIHSKYRSFLAVPLMRENQCNGSIMIRRPEVGPFTEKQINLVKTFADQAAIAIENVRLFNETQRLLKETEQRNAELAIINSVQEGLVTHLDFNSIIHLVGGKLGEIFDVSTIQINIYDRAQNLMHIPYCFEEGNLHTHGDVDLDAPHWFISHMKQIIETRQTVIINENTLEVARQRGGPTTPPEGARWSLCMVGVPLIAKGEATGVIWLMDNDRENVFTEPMVRLLQTLANSMSVALENARLWEQEKMYRKALQRELEIGREIQAGFLPDALPLVKGWEIAASLMSAREVAGDFYDAFELPDGSVGLVIADVCDKGVGAALFMTLFRSLIRAAANLDYFEQTENADAPRSSKERLQRAISLTNNYIAETHGESGMFATLFFGILDPRDGRLIYINGGHEPPLIVEAGRVRESLCKTGPAVGAITNGYFEILETQMQPGDVFFAFTDGVPDCQNSRGEFFGHEGLFDILQRDSNSALEVVKSVESELHKHIGNTAQFDDITLLAVRRSPEPTQVP